MNGYYGSGFNHILLVEVRKYDCTGKMKTNLESCCPVCYIKYSITVILTDHTRQCLRCGWTLLAPSSRKKEKL